MPTEIPLTRGHIAVVDDADADLVTTLKWHFSPRKYTAYAGANMPGTGRPGRRMKYVFMHRFIMQPPPDMFVDHRDGDGLNNQRSNLRVCTCADNTRNRRVSFGTSRYKGVHFCKDVNKWRAAIQADTLGFFDSESLAAAAYDAEALKRYGPFAALNLTGDVTHDSELST